MKLTHILKCCVVILLCTCTAAKAQIRLAGIYELNKKIDGETYQMYLELDFVNQRPDFTQTFTAKTATFKLLPADFMNVKKLTKSFRGTKAPGFGRFRDKSFLSLTEEFRITNPHSKGGVILAEWENELGKKGKVVIIPDTDGALVTYGLTDFSNRKFSPDGLRIELVKDLLPENGEPRWTGALTATPPTDGTTPPADPYKPMKEKCKTDLKGVIDQLQKMPDDTGKNAPANNKNTPADDKGTTDGNQINIELWGDNHPVVFKFHTISNGGDFGKFETNSQLDFWREDNGEISMRMYATTVYVNSGNTREYEYIYTGRRKGNRIVFTRRMDSLNGGDYEPLESYHPSVLIIKSPTKIVFDKCTYTKK